MGADGEHPLFRKEVLQRGSRLYGDINLAVPISWQIIGYLIFGILLLALLFLTTTSYTKVQTVDGAIALDTGVAQIVPSRAGTITAIAAREGSPVRAGQALVRIRSAEYTGGGDTTPERMKQALAQQDARIAAQTASLLSASEAEQQGFSAQIAGLKDSIDSLSTQVDEQRQLVAVAQADHQRAQALAAKAFLASVTSPPAKAN